MVEITAPINLAKLGLPVGKQAHSDNNDAPFCMEPSVPEPLIMGIHSSSLTLQSS
jgi:hypothetical protein